MIIAGVVLVVLGLVFFLQNTGIIPYDTWSNIWPILIVLIGLVLILSRRGWYGMKDWRRMDDGEWINREERGVGGMESRAYGHEPERKNRGRVHDEREDEA